MADCGNISPVGYACVLKSGHPGHHRSIFRMWKRKPEPCPRWAWSCRCGVTSKTHDPRSGGHWYGTRLGAMNALRRHRAKSACGHAGTAFLEDLNDA